MNPITSKQIYRIVRPFVIRQSLQDLIIDRKEVEHNLGFNPKIEQLSDDLKKLTKWEGSNVIDLQMHHKGLEMVQKLVEYGIVFDEEKLNKLRKE